MNIRERAAELLTEYELCARSRPKHGAIDLQIDKDSCNRWATQLNNLLAWGEDNDIAEACYQLEPRLTRLKEKLILEVLKHGI